MGWLARPGKDTVAIMCRLPSLVSHVSCWFRGGQSGSGLEMSLGDALAVEGDTLLFPPIIIRGIP